MNAPNDFTRPLAELIASLEQRVRLGVEQPRDVTVVYRSTLASYELPPDTIAVTRVAGWRGNRYGPFEPGKDYSDAGGRLLWQGEPADEGTRLEIETVWREPPSGLTDFNPGSVAGTLLRAVARELGLMYAQMDEAYRRAFIDDATGVALDNVVALFGVKRKPAQPARGHVTFARKKPATEAVQIPAGTRVADRAGRGFATGAPAQILASAEEIRVAAGAVITTEELVGEVIGVWPRSADPAATPALPARKPAAPPVRRIELVAPPAAGTELRVRYKPLSVRVPVVALQPGIEGNVDPGTLVLMPTPPRDVDSVTNEDRTQGGQQAEDDDRLRERAKHALERAGNATINAIRFAVLQVEGVQGVEVFDHQRDRDIQLGELRVRYAGPESDELLGNVVAAVERTRAAGVMARVERITPVTLTGRFVLVPGQPGDPAAGGAFVAAAAALIDSLAIGQALSLRRLQALAFQQPGLADLAEAQLQQHQPQPSSPGQDVTGDTLIVGGQQMIRADATGLAALMLDKLVAASHAKIAAGRYRVNLQLHDAGGRPVPFGSFAPDIAVAARAALQSNPTEPPVRVGAFTRKVSFTGSDTAVLEITVATDLPGFVVAEHVREVQFVFSAGAYPGLKPAARGIDVVT